VLKRDPSLTNFTDRRRLEGVTTNPIDKGVAHGRPASESVRVKTGQQG
jgi:hypothetical protein